MIQNIVQIKEFQNINLVLDPLFLFYGFLSLPIPPSVNLCTGGLIRMRDAD